MLYTAAILLSVLEFVISRRIFVHDMRAKHGTTKPPDLSADKPTDQPSDLSADKPTDQPSDLDFVRLSELEIHRTVESQESIRHWCAVSGDRMQPP